MSSAPTNRDIEFMRLAIGVAQNGVGQCSPNPPVGALIVSQGELIGKGYHHGAGQPHAEREALADAQRRFPERIEGSTAYVTLEPCSTHGRTPPCCDALIEAKVARCVYACTDPNPAHAGAAQQRLSEAGIEVSSGVLADEAQVLIRGFSSAQQRSRPWVISKLGLSLDGRLSRPHGESQWLTSPASRERVQALRAEVDAILVGANTVRRDNPRLNLRGPWAVGRRQPRRVVLLRERAKLPADCHLLTDEQATNTLIIEQQSPLEALTNLATRHSVNTLLLEAGSNLQGIFFEAGLVDEVRFFYAPLLSGGPDLAIGGNGISSLAESTRLSHISWQQHGDDLEMSALVEPATKD